MKLFGRKGAALPRPALSRAFAAGSVLAGEWPAHYEGQVRDAVLANPVAQRALRLVSEAAGSAPLRFVLNDDAQPVRDLIHNTSGGQNLVETLTLYLMLHGNAYAQILMDGLDRPAELFALRPERVKIETDAQGWPEIYAYRSGDRVTRLPAPREGLPGQLVHMKTVHPLDDHLGLGCLGAAAGAVAIHNAATVWNKALLDNAARPSGALVHDGGRDAMPLSDAQFQRLRDEMEAAFTGAMNAGRPMLLDGGLRWERLSMSPADMDFVALKAAAARDIALAFGVPPMLLGLPGDNTYANYREANRALWRQTILPMLDKVLGGLAQGLRPWFTGLAIQVDFDRVAELSEEREALWDRVGRADFLTPEEKRVMLGLASREALA